MQDRSDQIVPLTPLGGRNNGRGARLAAAGVLVALTALVGAGALGRLAEPNRRPEPSANPTASGDRTGAETPSARQPQDGADTAQTGVVSLPSAGYSVEYAVDAAHRPTILDGSSLVVFGFGQETASGSYDGSIEVSVGTPARGAAILGVDGPVEVFGTTLEDLRTQYLRAQEGRVLVRSARELGGQLAIVVRLDGSAGEVRAVALAVHGGRTFVMTASGFGRLFGPVSDFPAEVGLERFVAGFRFGTSLFVSRQLGFQVPLPVEARPFGAALDLPSSQMSGLYVFDDGLAGSDGSWSHSIGVSVGTQLHPAFVRVLPSDSPQPRPRRIWTASLVELQAAYLAAIGGRVGSSTTIRLDGELALLMEQPDGLAAAVLAVHHGRIYLLETTGAGRPETAPHFEEFLAGFTFLD